MFSVKFAEGDTWTERSGDWDSVPRRKIRELSVKVPLVPLVVQNCKAYYCGRLANVGVGAPLKWQGYNVIVEKEECCLDIMITNKGIIPEVKEKDHLRKTVRPDTIREGTG